MLNAIPFIGWLMAIVLAACLAVPVWVFSGGVELSALEGLVAEEAFFEAILFFFDRLAGRRFLLSTLTAVPGINSELGNSMR